MEQSDVSSLMRSQFDGMPSQMRSAASFILDHPKEVALLSMREQARRAGVPPVTMTRLAKRLGLTGYDELRRAYADAVRAENDGGWFSTRAANLVARRHSIGEAGLIEEMISRLTSHIAALAQPKTIASLMEAADHLGAAEKIYCLGLRSCHPIAYQFAYVHSYFGDRAVLLDGPGGAGLDGIRSAPPGSALLVTSVRPYAQATVETVEYAATRGLKIIALTSSTASPVARRAAVVIRLETRSPSFFDTMTQAFAVGEILIALLAARSGTEVASVVRTRESELKSFGVFWSDKRRRRQ
jgi:DNA-binding MurR/RpiR family transcriptional regulator